MSAANPPAVFRAVARVVVQGGLNVLGHTGIGGTLALTEATVAAVAAGEVEGTGARARVHGDGLLDDEAIGDELADRLARVGIADLADLAGVEPDLALADAQDGGRKPLLGPQINPGEREMLAFPMESVVWNRWWWWDLGELRFEACFFGSCEASRTKARIAAGSIATGDSVGQVSRALTS